MRFKSFTVTAQRSDSWERRLGLHRPFVRGEGKEKLRQKNRVAVKVA
jgi:hypothetical protein